MTLRAETIMATVLTTVTGLTTTGSRTERSKVRTIETTPALSVEQGADNVAPDRLVYPNVGKDLNIKIVIHTKLNTDPETQLNLIREEVYTALMTDMTLGLAFVIDVEPIGDDEPEYTGDADQITARLSMNFIIKYQHSWTDAGA